MAPRELLLAQPVDLMALSQVTWPVGSRVAFTEDEQHVIISWDDGYGDEDEE